MTIEIQSIINALNTWAPLSLQEPYDNAGVQVGDSSQECTGTLICLDITLPIIEEAIEKKCNLIISHHPLIFKGIQSITGKNEIEQCLIKAIKNNIVLYSTHTNLDSIRGGVSAMMANKIGLNNLTLLSPRPKSLYKLYSYVPLDHKDQVLSALYKVGAGHIGNYSECSFSTQGIGSFKPSDQAQPTIGTQGGEQTIVEETKIEVLLPFYLKDQAIHALKAAHPYEEVAYECIALENHQNEWGFGMVGNLGEKVHWKSFLKQLQDTFHVPSIKHTPCAENQYISKVAVCGGSGAFLIPSALKHQADIYITGDLKYHDFFQAENKIILADIGHFESEQFTIELIYNFLQEKFPKFAHNATSIHTNPIKYFI